MKCRSCADNGYRTILVPPYPPFLWPLLYPLFPSLVIRLPGLPCECLGQQWNNVLIGYT